MLGTVGAGIACGCTVAGGLAGVLPVPGPLVGGGVGWAGAGEPAAGALCVGKPLPVPGPFGPAVPVPGAAGALPLVAGVAPPGTTTPGAKTVAGLVD